MNAHRGDVAITIDGKVYAMRFDYEALASLTDALGRDFDQKLALAAVEFDLRTLCKAVEIGTGGKVSAETIYAKSPPLVALNESIRKGLNLAFHGTEDGPIERPTMANRIKWAWRILFAKASETPFALE